MKQNVLSSVVLGLVSLLLVAADAGAAKVAGENIAPRHAPKTPPPSSTPTLDLIAGTISSVDTSRRTMIVSGTAVSWHPAQLRVYAANGRLASEQDLRPGARIRFALEAGTSQARRAVLVYVDERP